VFRSEKDRADKFENWYKDMEVPYQATKDEAHRLKLEVIRYEQKYGFIDIDKLHEQIQTSNTKHEQANHKTELLERDLFEIRERILDATQKFDKGSKKSKKKEEWKGSEDVEKLCSVFTTYLTSPENFTNFHFPKDQGERSIPTE